MVNKNILRFKISMQYSFRMNICYSVKYLFEDYFNLFLIDFIVLACNKFFKVEVIVVKYDFKHLFFRFVEDIQEGYNVDMFFECFEK